MRQIATLLVLALVVAANYVWHLPSPADDTEVAETKQLFNPDPKCADKDVDVVAVGVRGLELKEVQMTTESLLKSANATFAASNVTLELVLSGVSILKDDPAQEMRNDVIALAEGTKFKEAIDLRSQKKADIVLLLGPWKDKCGWAYTNASAETAVAAVAMECGQPIGDYRAAHEFGHLAGSAHAGAKECMAADKGEACAPYADGRGFVFPGAAWGTIMRGDGGNVIPRWSDKSSIYQELKANLGDKSADNVSLLKRRGPVLAGFVCRNGA